MNIEQVWSKYQTNLKRFLHSKISNPSEVDEVLQQILIKVFENLPTLSSPAKIKPWLFQIANNTIIDFYRQQKKQSVLSEQSLWYEQDEETVQEQLSDCVLPFIKALPKKHQQLLEAIDINGVSQKQYAQDHNLSYSTLKSQVQKARTELKNLFDRCCQYTLDKQGNLVEFVGKSNKCSSC